MTKEAGENQHSLHAAEHFAATLRGFGPAGIISILAILLTGNLILDRMVVLPVGAVLALLWVRLSHTPWRDIGYARPASWIGSLALGFAFGIAFKIGMKTIVMPLIGADPVNHAYHFLAGNTSILPTAILAMFIVGFAEETVFRGYLFERLGKLFGSGAVAKISIVILTSAWFGLAHYLEQGLAGTEQATIVGLVFGTIYTFTGRIFMLMCAHAAFDLTALAIIYWNVESEVAHWIFQ